MTRPIELLTAERRGIHGLMQAVVEAIEEAVPNCLAPAETTAGRDGNVAHVLPIERGQDWLR